MSDFRAIGTGRRCRVGEGAYWLVRQQALYWGDTPGQSAFRLRPGDCGVTTRQVPKTIGSLIERVHTDGFAAGVQGDCVYVRPEPLTTTPIARREPNLPTDRFNDAKADARGRVWAGTLPLSAEVKL